jgi:hypothetical protein
MTNHATKLSALALIAALAVAAPAFADDTPAGVASDVNAVQKDNSAMSKSDADLARHRAMKAKDKANGSYGSQAVDSVNIAKDKTVKGEKEQEKSIDKKSLNNDVDSSTEQQSQ